MTIRDMIIDIDQMSRNNREYSKTQNRESDIRREEEAARRTMEILHNFELAGMKSAEEAVAALRIYSKARRTISGL